MVLIKYPDDIFRTEYITFPPLHKSSISLIIFKMQTWNIIETDKFNSNFELQRLVAPLPRHCKVPILDVHVRTFSEAKITKKRGLWVRSGILHKKGVFR